MNRRNNQSNVPLLPGEYQPEPERMPVKAKRELALLIALSIIAAIVAMVIWSKAYVGPHDRYLMRTFGGHHQAGR